MILKKNTRMKYFIVFMLSVFFLIDDAEAQNNARYSPEFTPFSQFYFQPSFYNPAYVGNEYSPTFWASSRVQNSLQDRSRSFNGTYQIAMERAPINWGFIMVYQDFNTLTGSPDVVTVSELRNYRAFQGGIQANFDFDIGEKGVGKVGLAASMLNFKNADTDLAVSVENPRTWVPSVDLGVLFNYDHFHLGVGLINANNPSFDFSVQNTGSGGLGTGGGGTNLGSTPSFRRSMYINALYRINVTETLMLEPNVLIRQADGTSISINSAGGGVELGGLGIDLALVLNYYNFIFAGYSYKPQISSNQGFVYNNFGSSVMAGIRFNETYHISFSWDLRRENVNENTNQFEIGIGAYLFGEYLFAE